MIDGVYAKMELICYISELWMMDLVLLLFLFFHFLDFELRWQSMT